jgi:hypothetical protein
MKKNDDDQKVKNTTRHRSNKAEMDERVDILFKCRTEQRAKNRQLIQLAMERWGVSKRTAQRYVNSLEKRSYVYAHESPAEILSTFIYDAQYGIDQAIITKELTVLPRLLKVSSDMVDKLSKFQSADYGQPIAPKYKTKRAKKQETYGAQIWLPDNGRGDGPLPSRIGPPPD